MVERGVGIALREHVGVLEGLLAPIDDPHLRARYAPDDVARDRCDAARPAVRARHKHHDLARLGRPDLLHEDLVVLRRSRGGRDLHRHVAVNGPGRRGEQKSADQHEEWSQTTHGRRQTSYIDSWRLDPEQVERARQHFLGLHADHDAHILVAALLGRSDHAAVAVEGGESLGGFQRVGGHPVRRAPGGRLAHLAGKLKQPLEERAGRGVELLGTRTQIGAHGRRHPLLPRLAQNRRDPRVGVLHVVHGVVLRLLTRQLQVEVYAGVVAARDQEPARGVHADVVDQVVEADDRSRAL